MKKVKIMTQDFLTKLELLNTILPFLLKNMKWTSEKSKIDFQFLTGINRGIVQSHVTKLAKSLMKIGNIRPIIVAKLSFMTGKIQYFVIDGQHVMMALIRLGWPIPYVTIEIKDKQDLVEKIAMLNASSKSWSFKDYINSWACLNEEYVKLNNYGKTYDIEFSIVAAILNEESLTSANSIGNKIKTGQFIIKNEKFNKQILDDLTDILKIIPRMNRFQNRYACSEYVNFRRTLVIKYDHKGFMKNLYKNKEKFIFATQEKSKLADMFKVLAK